MVVGSPALNQNAFAVLAFGGLTRNDVKLVEFSSYGAMWKGIINNEVDAAIASTISRPGEGGRGLAARARLPADARRADKAGWARLNKIGPYYVPHKATCGVGISAQSAGRAAELSVSDLHGLRVPAGGRRATASPSR